MTKTTKKDLLLELDVRLTLLNLQSAKIVELVTSGQLTQDVYVQMIKNKIEEEKALVKTLTAQGDKVRAQEATKRINWMQEEIAGC